MARPIVSRGRRPIALLAAAATGVAGMALLAPSTSVASSHREAPFTSFNPEIDNTDVYTFVSPDDPDSVTLVANFWPNEEPDGGPNFYKFDADARYEVNVDNNGDAVADLTYRWTFTDTYRTQDTFLYNTGVVESFEDETLNFRQFYDLEVIAAGAAPVLLLDNAPVAPSNVGPASMPDYEALREDAIVDLTAGLGGKAFAGQADDSFFLDLRVFDLLYGAPDFDEVGNDTLNGKNVQTLALQLPKQALALNSDATRNPVIGVWSTTSLPQQRVLADNGTEVQSGPFVQVSRLGNPLVNELVIPLKDKDRFNASTPARDAQFLPYVTDPEVPKLVEALYDIPAPATPRNDLVRVFLTGVPEVNSLEVNQDVATAAAGEMLRLNTSIPPSANPDRLGVIGDDVAGYPNGRRLADDVVDISLQVVEGELAGAPNDLSDAVDSNDLPFGDTFPYVALPHNSAANQSQFQGFQRRAGPDRFGTAAEIALDTFGTSDTVLLASGMDRNLPDSLAGNYLAGFEDAPILLTTPGTLPAVTRAAIEELGAERIIVLGGSAAVSNAQLASLDAAYDVTRIGGRDRYETAALIATTPPDDYVGAGTAIVARGDVMADALVSGPISYRAQFPILLTPTGSANAFTRTALDELSVERVLLAGGSAAVSEATATALSDGGDIIIERIFGGDRFATAVAMAKFATGELDFPRLHVNLARGDVFADALTGGPHAGVEGSVIVLTVNPSTLGTATANYLTEESITLEGGHIFGGSAAVSAAVVAAATDAANSNDQLQDPSKQ